MRDIRIFVEKINREEMAFVIDNSSDVNKLKNVLRMQVGDNLHVVDSNGDVFDAVIESISDETVSGSLKEELPVAQVSSLKISLAQALPKASKMDTIIRMNTELGVLEFIPFETKYSVVKLRNFNLKKLSRWRKIARSASEQSERTDIPEIREPVPFDELLQMSSETKLLLHSRNENAQSLKAVCDKLKNPTDILVAIGPEGGFSEEEMLRAKESGWEIVWMDMPILRTETAGVVAVAQLKALLS